jgi:hypothetical protein
MRKGETPDFTVRWWKGSQPKDLPSAGKLESALKNYEGAKSKLDSSREEPDAKAADKALTGVVDAAQDVITEADKKSKTKGDEMSLTAECLKKFKPMSNAERKWIEEHTGEEDDGMFSDPDVYRHYLLTALKALKVKGEMNFALVLGKKAEDHRLALHKTKGSKQLKGNLTNETGLRAATCGTARTDEDPNSEDDESEDKHVIFLQLQEKALPGMARKTTRMLKKFKIKKFKQVVLMDASGTVLEDEVDATDTDTDEVEIDAGALTKALAELARRIQGVTDPARKAELARLATQANALLRSNNLPEAAERIEELRTALDQTGVPGNGGNGATQEVGGSSPAAFTKSRQIWIAARKRVEDEIEKLRAEIVATYQSDGIANDLETRYRARVSDILKTLDESLSEKLNEVAGAVDMAQRAKLIAEARGIMERYQSYLASEPLIADLDDNPFVPLSIRQTVSTTLSALEKVVH